MTWMAEHSTGLVLSAHTAPNFVAAVQKRRDIAVSVALRVFPYGWRMPTRSSLGEQHSLLTGGVT